MTPIERACIAVIDNLREQGDLMADCGDPEWAQVDGAFRVEPVVRAILTAMREPSHAMQKAACEQRVSFRSGSGMYDIGKLSMEYPDEPDKGAGTVWRTMIDAALQEG